MKLDICRCEPSLSASIRMLHLSKMYASSSLTLSETVLWSLSPLGHRTKCLIVVHYDYSTSVYICSIDLRLPNK